MRSRLRFLPILLLCLSLVAASSIAGATNRSNNKGTILNVLVNTDGAQALVAAVLVVDESQVLDFSLAELLGDRRAELVLFAPSNPAFEDLLGLDPGTLDGLSIDQVKEALPGLLPDGVGPNEVASILLKHAGIVRKANRSTVSDRALLSIGSVTVADGSEFPISIGATGVTVNRETTIIRPNLRTRNGFIHFVDTVILDDLL